MKAASAFVLCTGIVALGADFLASARPLLARIGGRTYVLPNLFASELDRTNMELWARLGPGEWILEPWVPWGPNEQDLLAQPLAPPGARHWLGTDLARRDVLARLVHATRWMLLISVPCALLSVALGTCLGLWAAVGGRLFDVALRLAVETLHSIPVLFLLIAMMALVRHGSVLSLMGVIVLVSWAHVARLVRQSAHTLLHSPHVQTARVLGLSRARIALTHMAPNLAGIILSCFVLGIAHTTMIESALTFFGLGLGGVVPTFGSLLQHAASHPEAWWLVVFPGGLLFANVLAYSVLAQHLETR